MELSSRYSRDCDDGTGKCTVQFMDGGKQQRWRFDQSSDWINPNFLGKLLEYAEARSGMKILALETEDWYTGVVLPRDLYDRLTGEGLLDEAA